MHKFIAALLLTLAVLRATRFVTTDWLGEWWLVGPAKKWAVKHDELAMLDTLDEGGKALWTTLPDSEKIKWLAEQGTIPSSRSKLVKGLDCPFCVGFWIGLMALVVSWMPLPGWLAGVRNLAISAFALNYVVGHVSSRIDG